MARNLWLFAFSVSLAACSGGSDSEGGKAPSAPTLGSALSTPAGVFTENGQKPEAISCGRTGGIDTRLKTGQTFEITDLWLDTDNETSGQGETRREVIKIEENKIQIRVTPLLLPKFWHVMECEFTPDLSRCETAELSPALRAEFDRREQEGRDDSVSTQAGCSFDVSIDDEITRVQRHGTYRLSGDQRTMAVTQTEETATGTADCGNGPIRATQQSLLIETPEIADLRYGPSCRPMSAVFEAVIMKDQSGKVLTNKIFEIRKASL